MKLFDNKKKLFLILIFVLA